MRLSLDHLQWRLPYRLLPWLGIGEAAVPIGALLSQARDIVGSLLVYADVLLVWIDL